MFHLILLLCACSDGTKSDESGDSAVDTGEYSGNTLTCEITGIWSSQVLDTHQEVTVDFDPGGELTIADRSRQDLRISNWSQGPDDDGVSIVETSLIGVSWMPCYDEQPAVYVPLFSEDCNTATLTAENDPCYDRAMQMDGMLLVWDS